MRKKMTPCEKLGYKVGDKFTVIKDSYFEKGTIVALSEDDGSEVPWFTRGGVRRALIIGSNPDVEPVAKLKPAKQALADAIHQNGGWMHGAEYAAQDKCAQVTMFRSKPIRHGNTWLDDEGFDDVGGFGCDKIQNWHQCILSRDEYFIAYPEQVKVEVKNETKHKVEVEMESESEMTIKVSDWHKNGELPPVGEICIFSPPPCSEHYFPDFTLKAKGKEVLIIAHTRFNRGVGDVAVMKWDFGDSGGVCSANQMCFIPLLTEREKAIDEMVGVARDIGYSSNNSIAIIGDVASAMYDLGYRKEAK